MLFNYSLTRLGNFLKLQVLSILGQGRVFPQSFCAWQRSEKEKSPYFRLLYSHSNFYFCAQIVDKNASNYVKGAF